LELFGWTILYALDRLDGQGELWGISVLLRATPRFELQSSCNSTILRMPVIVFTSCPTLFYLVLDGTRLQVDQNWIGIFTEWIKSDLQKQDGW
jgi:hypothetical protein